MRYDIFLLEADGTWTPFEDKETLAQAVVWAERKGVTYKIWAGNRMVFSQDLGRTVAR